MDLDNGALKHFCGHNTVYGYTGAPPFRLTNQLQGIFL